MIRTGSRSHSAFVAINRVWAQTEFTPWSLPRCGTGGSSANIAEIRNIRRKHELEWI